MEFNSATLRVFDVEELSYTVDPWQFLMTQLSAGKFLGVMHTAQIGDIFVSREHWSHRINANGATPAGYLSLAGPCDQSGFSWCGTQTDKTHLAYALDSHETDFVTSDHENHWTVLIPTKTIMDYLGEEIVAALPPGVRTLTGDSRFVGQLSSTVLHLIAALQTNNSQLDRGHIREMSRNNILATTAQLLLAWDHYRDEQGDVNKRRQAYCQARCYQEGLREAIPVKELAKKVGVCRRTLELAFMEAVGVSPGTFLTRTRLNGLHRELLRASPQTGTVTEAAVKWGFTELGRTAGKYRDLFGEKPLDTLRSNSQSHGERFADILAVQ